MKAIVFLILIHWFTDPPPEFFQYLKNKDNCYIGIIILPPTRNFGKQMQKTLPPALCCDSVHDKCDDDSQPNDRLYNRANLAQWMPKCL